MNNLTMNNSAVKRRGWVAVAASCAIALLASEAAQASCHQECALPNPFSGGCAQEANVCIPETPQDVAGIPGELNKAYQQIQADVQSPCAQALSDWFGANAVCASAIAGAVASGGTLWVGAGFACSADGVAIRRTGDACGGHMQIQYLSGVGAKTVFLRNDLQLTLSSLMMWPVGSAPQTTGGVYSIVSNTDRLAPYQATGNYRRATPNTFAGCMWHVIAGYHFNNNFADKNSQFVSGDVDVCTSTSIDIQPGGVRGS